MGNYVDTANAEVLYAESKCKQNYKSLYQTVFKRIIDILLCIMILNSGMVVTNSQNVVAGVAFMVCLPGAINLSLSRTGNIPFSSDSLWRVLQIKGEEERYEAICLKIGKILTAIAIPLTIVAVIVEF